MPKVLFCDTCGAKDANEDYDEKILCTLHRAEDDLVYLNNKHKEQREWVRSVWFTKLVENRKEILRLRNVVRNEHKLLRIGKESK